MLRIPLYESMFEVKNAFGVPIPALILLIATGICLFLYLKTWLIIIPLLIAHSGIAFISKKDMQFAEIYFKNFKDYPDELGF